MQPDRDFLVETGSRYTGLPRELFATSVISELSDFEIPIPISTGPQRRPASRIDLGAIDVPLSIAVQHQRRWSMRCAITLEAATVRLLEVALESEAANPEIVPTPTGLTVVEQLAAHNERYLDFPTDPPELTLLMTLDRVHASGYASPMNATRIEAFLLKYEWMTHPRPAVWAITFNGLPPWPVTGPPGAPAPDVPVWQRNHLRHVVDATSGEILFATTIPQPAAT